MNIRPLYDRVVIKRKDEPSKSAGGLFLPETAKEKPIQGEVVAVGSGRVSDDGEVTPLQVEVGNVVVFGKFVGTEIKVDGEEVVILREDDILGVIE